MAHQPGSYAKIDAPGDRIAGESKVPSETASELAHEINALLADLDQTLSRIADRLVGPVPQAVGTSTAQAHVGVIPGLKQARMGLRGALNDAQRILDVVGGAG